MQTSSHTIRTETTEFPEGTIDTRGELSNPWTEEDLRDDLNQCLCDLSDDYFESIADNDPDNDLDDPFTSFGNRSTYEPEFMDDPNGDPSDIVDDLEMRKMRFRFEIPWNYNPPPEPAEQRWHGSYHRIQYQIIFSPADGGDEVVVAEEESIWEGPGEELDTADDWDMLTPEEQEERRDLWRTEWVVVDIPDEPGEVRVDLLRSQCFTGGAWTNH